MTNHTSPFTVRRATLADASGILTCLHAAFAPYESSYTAEAYAHTILGPETLFNRLQEMSIFVAVNGSSGGIIGTIACHVLGSGDGHLRGMAVLPDWQGSGIAHRLLESVEFELRACGCRQITLDTTAPLQRAVSFYTKNGYRATGRVTDFFGMPLFEYAKLF